MPLKTRQQIRAEFAEKGVSVSEWSRRRGFTAKQVLDILNDDERAPRYKCLRGQAHDIAVELGLKRGTARPLSQRLQLSA